MEKTEQQVRKEVLKVIEGFLVSFIEEYCELYKKTRTKDACHQYVKDRAEKGKQSFVAALTLDYNDTEVKSYKTIEDNWLSSIETLKDFELFLEKTKKVI
jgi:hypothetical protein